MQAHLVNAAGASAVLNEGYVTYSNEAKAAACLEFLMQTLEQLMGLSATRRRREMAEGAAKAAGAEAALSATGIAGPSGGNRGQACRTRVYRMLSERGDSSKRMPFSHGNRMENRAQTVETALEMLKDALLKE